MYPHERSLVKRLEGKPFAILGVNSDRDREEVREAVKKEQIAWRSFWNGGVEGPIAVRWNVHSWPTLYILDAQGVIRWKGVGSNNQKAIDETVETLLKGIVSSAGK
jgi:hypothetical protein